MATYKLIQDIEAEDHILGPLTLRQFIFAMVAAFLYYIAWFIVSKSPGAVTITMVSVLLGLPALFFTFFAIPFGRDQSTEIWALAKLRYFLKPRRRVWDQTGVKELVTITVPKKIERVLTDGLGQEEVRSRLHALANTLDSRGWAVKNVSPNSFNYNNPFEAQTSERLLDIGAAAKEVPNEVYVQNDILDDTSSPVAQQMATRLAQAERKHKQDIIDKMNNAALAERLKNKAPAKLPPANEQQPDYWFMNQPPASQLAPNETMFSGSPAVQPGVALDAGAAEITPDEQIIIEHAKAEKKKEINKANAHMRVLTPLKEQQEQAAEAAKREAQKAQATSTETKQGAIIKTLASNDNVSIATLAKMGSQELSGGNNEVVVSLH